MRNSTPAQPGPGGGGLSRRGLLAGGTAAAAATFAATVAGSPAEANGGVAVPHGRSVESFHGPHQGGVATLPQTYAVFLGLDLRKGTDRDALGRLMRLLTDDARRLTEGRPALADTEPELAVLPARLSVTFGFGPGFFTAAEAEDRRPRSLKALPEFKIDKLEKRWSGGDLLVQICSDDAVTLSHALRMIVKDVRAFAEVRWLQRGFRRPPHVEAPGLTQRNLMGQLDGTVNHRPGTPDFDKAVWVADDPAWLRGGTMLVLRRIRMELETWDAVDRVAKEFSVGRRLDTGAPLTGRAEHDPPDFERLNDVGFPVISEFSHVRRAHVADPGLRIFRRAYNYDEGLTARGRSDSGLIFASYQADIERQFVPIQRRLAEVDLLNEWTTPIGSAVFAIPPGCSSSGWIGETLLS
ncbi:Dyp-type peroxidase [Sinosporangium siamense]|uniref:Peroxidase n=1 Tax=Sinosporangium siamense TaxID=1367973 RepID=A0A919V3W1_9ACTN|nr:Dyp-type peroxidase [Sinosporangium siamense]GII89898.1 peroxidase [Sinosporangium siamense]